MINETIIIAGSAASIGFVHTLLGPDHYLPLVAMAKTNGWSAPKTASYVAVCGDVDERTLAQFARQIEDGLLAQPEISLVELDGVRRPEILVEVPQAQLRSPTAAQCRDFAQSQGQGQRVTQQLNQVFGSHDLSKK